MASPDPLPGAGPELGSVLDGKYRLARELASGAMGRLVEAEHLLLERPVAIKLVSSTPDARSRRRMMQEARAAQQLSSEHVVRVFDVGLVGDSPYIVMELLVGSDLGMLVAERGPLPIMDAVDYVLQACVGMAEAHAAGIIHRDLKPSNLFLSRTAAGATLIKIVDFGISKVGEPARLEDATGERTADGSLLGSPYYMSPEQLRNPTRVDARTDVWALAVTLFQLLSGAYPFEGETVNEVSAAIFTEPPRDLGALRAEVPEELRKVIARALAKRPEERTASMVAFAAELAPFASDVGRMAAERLAARPTPTPPVEHARAMAHSGELSATDPALGTTLPALSSDKPPDAGATLGEAGQRRRSKAKWLLAATGGIVAAALLALWYQSLTPAPLAHSTASATQAVPPAPPPEPARAPQASAAPVPPVASEASARVSGPTAARVARTAAPPTTPAPSASPSARPSPPNSLDIDGVPIVE
jgi:serine/threonine-protein kinase